MKRITLSESKSTKALLTSYDYVAFYIVPRYKIPGTMYYVLLHSSMYMVVIFSIIVI